MIIKIKAVKPTQAKARPSNSRQAGRLDLIIVITQAQNDKIQEDTLLYKLLRVIKQLEDPLLCCIADPSAYAAATNHNGRQPLARCKLVVALLCGHVLKLKHIIASNTSLAQKYIRGPTQHRVEVESHEN